MASRGMVQVAGEGVGITNLQNNVADHLARSVDARLRDVVKGAIQFMKHAHRTKLTTEDINMSLRLRHAEPVYGYSSSDPLAFGTAGDDLFFVPDRVVHFDAVLEEDLAPVPVAPSFAVHWLAVDGVQPRIPENPSEGAIAAAQAKEATAHGGEEGAKAARRATEQTSKPLVKHALSKEQQLYFQHVTVAIKGSDDILRKAALKSVGFDQGLHQLVPYLTQFLADEVPHSMRNLSALRSLMQLAHSLVTSPHLRVEPYLHQLMPPVLTCLVGRRLCSNPLEDHWSLRDFAASLVAKVCARFGPSYRSLQPRISKTLTRAFLDPNRPLTTHYGAIVGLHALGPHVTRALLLPHLPAYLRLLDEALLKAVNPTKRMEATHCRAALQHATGQYVRGQFREAYSVPLLQPQAPLQAAAQEGPSWKKAKTTKATKTTKTTKKQNGEVVKMEEGEDGEEEAAKEEEDKEGRADGSLSSQGMASLFELFGETLLPYARVEGQGAPPDAWDLCFI